jgi:hypothetical protein
MKAAFDAKGLTNVTSVDVNPTIEYVYGAVKTASLATFYGNYHGTYEPPFCHQQARIVFDALK